MIDMTEDEIEELFDLILLHEEETFLSIIDEIEDINVLNKHKENLLHKAISEELFDSCKELINRGINVNQQQKDGMTALYYLSDHVNVEIAQLILEKGGDVNIKDDYGNNALWAVLSSSYNVEMIKMYLNAGADLDSKNDYDKSVRDILSRFESHTEIMALFAEK